MNTAAKPIWFILFVVAGLVAVVGIAKLRGGSIDGDGKGQIDWQSDLSAARDQAGQEKKRVLLYFTAGWCPPCQKMKAGTWKDSAVADVVKQKYVPVMIDVDDQPMVAREYGVQGIPRVEMLTESGDRKLLTEGLATPAQMVEMLE
jgi:protein disulfide-isomerase